MNVFAGQDRDTLRAAWKTAWQRHTDRLPLDPLQAQMADLVAMHPEYHQRMSSGTSLETDHNAYLHLGLHMALREQLSTQRPPGIVEVYQTLATRADTLHDTEHRMIDVLAQSLWEAQRAGRMPDQQHYLDALRRLR